MKKTAFHSFDNFYIDYIKNNRKHNMPLQHYHDSYEFYLQVSGERYIFLGDICYTLKKGDFVLFKPFVLHYAESRNVNYYERYVMNFHCDKLSCILNKTEMYKLFDQFDSCIIHLNEIDFHRILDLFQTADLYSKKSGFLSEKLLYSVVFQLVMLLSEISEFSEKVTSKNLPSEIIKSILYINKNYNENINLEQLSDMVSLSKYHFCRLFHYATGATFLEYLYNVRLTNVHKLLLETELSISEIAGKTGFSSTAHLSRTFHKVYHMSPREFRKKSISTSISGSNSSELI